MPPEPVPAEPEWDDDPAWTRADPMTAAELEAGLDWVCEHDEPPGPEEFEDLEPLTPEELTEIREAAADELLAVEAATTGRRGPGQPGSARVFPGQSSSPAASFGPGMPLDILPGCAGLAVAADAAAGEDGGFSPGCRRLSSATSSTTPPYEAGGRTCRCNTGPKCRHDHRLKQHPKWTVDQLPDGTFRWTTPSGRTYTTEPTRYPI
jgi:hypothetical protein